MLETLKRYDNDKYLFITENTLPIYYLPILSDPTETDTDYDGLNDDVDPSPCLPFDKRFYISDNYQNTVPESDFVKRAWQEGEDCYGSVVPE